MTRNLNETTGTSVSYYHLRSMVRPGLTGWAQVRYRYANNLEEEIEKLRYDLYYVKHVSVWLDLRILADTCRVLFSGGLSDGVETARPGVETVRARPFRRSTKAQSDEGGVMAHGVTEAQGEVACRICGEEDCVLHRGVVTVAQLVNVMLGLGGLDRVDGGCLGLGISQEFDDC